MNTNSRGGPGMGSSRSNTRNSTEPTRHNKETKYEFTPHTAGRHQPVTYDTVKEYFTRNTERITERIRSIREPQKGRRQRNTNKETNTTYC